ncbi:MAG: hypothetical protein KTR31_02510 [Myxococcales bacterium]|nr:hypothetical protein [Myxococcales bacterium]
MMNSMLLGLFTQAHALEPAGCGELHNQILDHFMTTELPSGTFEEVHAEVIAYVDTLEVEYDADIAEAWMRAADPADHAAARAAGPEHAAFLDHLDDIAALYEGRTSATTESDILDGLDDLDAAAQSTLVGGHLDIALCVTSVARSSTVYWYDRTEDWVMIHGDEDPDDDDTPPAGGMGTYDPGQDVDGWDVLAADALGAAAGAALYGLGSALPSMGTATVPGAIYGAVSAGAAGSALEGGWQKKDAEAAKAEEQTEQEAPPPDEEDEEDEDTLGGPDDGGDNGGGDVGGGSK